MRTVFSRASISFIALAALILAIGAGSALAQSGGRIALAGAVSLKTSPQCTKHVKRQVRQLLAGAESGRAARRIRNQRWAQLTPRCLRAELRASKRSAKAAASAAVPAGNLTIGIDGGYSSWNSEEIEVRAQLGAAVTRHEWDITEPVNAQDALVYNAAAKVHTRIHALLGANELGSASHYSEWVVSFIRRYGEGGSFGQNTLSSTPPATRSRPSSSATSPTTAG